MDQMGFRRASSEGLQRGLCAAAQVRRSHGGGTHHEAELRVLVRLRADEVVAVEHGDRILGARLETLELLKVGDGVDGGVAVGGTGADEDDARVLRALQIGQQQRHDQKVREVVDLHLLLVAVLRPLGMWQRRLVDARLCVAAHEGEAREGVRVG